jgi:integrase
MSEGHIRRRGKSSWEIKFDLGRDPLTGKRITKYKSIRGTKRDAQRELCQQLTAVNTGQFTDPGKLTLGEYLVWWLDNEAKNNTAPKTLQVYRYMADKHIIPALGACPMSQLRPLHITEYYNKKLQVGRVDGKGGLSPQSIRHHDRLLNVALKRARVLNLIPRNPVEDVSRPKVPDREIHTLNDRQIATLLTAIEGTRLYEPVFLALTTGLRRGEILGLRWGDLDLGRGTVTVQQSLEQTKAGPRFKSPKTRKGRRTVTLPGIAVEALREHRRRQAEERMALGLGKPKTIFTDVEGGPWPPDKLSRQFGNLVRKAGIGPITFHGLRHTHLTNLLREGVHPKVASERAGHSSVATTLDLYSHVTETLQREAAEKVDMAMRRALESRN